MVSEWLDGETMPFKLQYPKLPVRCTVCSIEFCGNSRQRSLYRRNAGPIYCGEDCAAKNSTSRWTGAKAREYRERLSQNGRINLDVLEICNMYQSGKDLRSIARKFNVTTCVIRHRLKNAGVETRKPGSGKPKLGPNNSHWKGDSAGRISFHQRVRRLRGTPSKCSICGDTNPSRRYEWANITGQYADAYDYIRMCRKCHSPFDAARRGIIGQRTMDLRESAFSISDCVVILQSILKKRGLMRWRQNA